MLDRTHRPQHRIELQILSHLGPLAHSGRIDNHKLVAEFIVIGRYGIARGARHGCDDIALLAQQGVGEGRFAHVRSAYDGDVREVCVVVIGPFVLRKDFDDFVQKVPGSGAVGCRYAPHLAKAEGVEVVRVVHLFAAVHLVHAQDHGLFAAAEKVGYLGVVIRDSGGGFAHEEHHIGLLHGYHHLPADGVLEHIVRIGGVSAGVHHGEFTAAPLALAVMTVPRYACGLVHNSLTHSHQAVEERGFAHIRAAHYRN